MLKDSKEALNGDGKMWKGDWETLERIWGRSRATVKRALRDDGKAFKKTLSSSK